MTESEDLVERVARALCEADGFKPDVQRRWVSYKDSARAAIEAIRGADLCGDCPELRAALQPDAAMADVP